MDISSLNARQKEAVTYTDGPLLVLAGAGSGKTRVLTYRIAYMVQECNVSPYRILALTFTNKAAREMKERTEKLLGSVAQQMWVSTFHSTCAKMLRFDGTSIGLDTNFTIYDDSERKSIIAPIMERLGIDEKSLNKAAALHIISDAKNHSTNPIVYLSQEYGDSMVSLYNAYEKAMRTANAVDFDDLILLVIKMLRECPEMLKKYRERFRYVLVDEYQDTNMPQYDLVHLLCEEHRNICVVGDDDQSIYGWRGADIRNILEFERDFPGSKVIRLEQNYRSTGSILDAANAVIENNKNRKGKKLWTASGSGDKICHYTAYDERDEANFICRTISSAVDRGASLRDHAVLYRTNAQSRVIESALLSYGIKYRVFGGQRFYERMEIKDIMAYLRLIANPNDNAAFKRIINVPPRSIGEKSLQTVENAAFLASRSIMSFLKDPMLFAGLTPALQKKFLPFLNLYDMLCQARAKYNVSALAQDLVINTGYLDYLSKYDGEFESRCQNIDELIGVINEIEEGLQEDEDALLIFLENAALATDMDEADGDGDNYVSVMTLHSAKGLEYHTVFIAGMEDGLFPSARSLESLGKLEEERRLCYVGITRARKKLYLISTVCRRLYNRSTTSKDSMFLGEIPSHLITNAGQQQRTFNFDSDDSSYYGYSSGYSSNRGGYGSSGYGSNRGSYGGNSGYGSNRGSYGGNSYDTNRGYGKASGNSRPKTERMGTAMPNMPTAQKQKNSAPPAPTANPQADMLQVGMTVDHSTFGRGFIVAKAGSGASAIVSVEFSDGNIKKLAAAFAPLTIVDK